MHRTKPALFILLFLVTITGGCKGHPPEKKSRADLPTAQVKAQLVSEQLTEGQNEATGTIEAVQRAVMASKVTGTIKELPVDVGSTVRKGDLLVKISAGEISARVTQAEAQFEQAKRNLEREKRLLEQEASTSETVTAMQNRFRVAEAAFREAKTMFAYTTINAPYGGVISAKHTQTGDLATPGTPLLVLENNKNLQAVASVPEALAAKLKLGDRLPIKLTATQTEITGKVKEIAPSTDPMSRTTTVKLKIDDISGLRPGQYVRLMLPGKTANAYMAPLSAISRYGQMERIFVVEGDKARLRLIRSGEQKGDMVEILSGIVTGEKIIVQSNMPLVDGQPVEKVQ